MALSPHVVYDGHEANQSLSMRSDVLLESRKKKRQQALRTLLDLGSWVRATFPPTQSWAQKEASLEESQVTVLEDMS